ncbi:MAG: class I SAM-dependent methyltransferase [Ignavibacteria bacterium]|nr:class I SAM-dependent methyltransferase [Ignavibacteria bacterium]
MENENIPINQILNNKNIVECLNTKIYSEFPELLIDKFSNYESNFHNFLKVLSIPIFFNKNEEINESFKNPIELFNDFLKDYIELIDSSKNSEFSTYFNSIVSDNTINQESELEIKLNTGSHYGNLFKEFNLDQFLEAKNLLETRLSRNNIDINLIKNKKILDQGCGGGRYTVALKLLGAKECYGVDYSEEGIADANHKMKVLNLENIKFIKNDVLSLEFDDNSFDFVFSNGVLHHTSNWQKGISELMRVLKPGGSGFLYLIENPGGLFWDSIEILRAINKKINKIYARNVMKSLNIPSNKIFYMLDHVLVPINTRLTELQIKDELMKNGATNILRLNRGVDFDRVEKLFNKIPYGKEKFGIGENRFIFSKN